MPYQRSLQIEQRLQTALSLIRRGRYSTPKIAAELHVSIPTVSRLVMALRERGHEIRAEKQTDGWRYVLDRAFTKKRNNEKSQQGSANRET